MGEANGRKDIYFGSCLSISIFKSILFFFFLLFLTYMYSTGGLRFIQTSFIFTLCISLQVISRFSL